MTGKGELLYARGSKYTGEFLNGEKNGKGTFEGYDGEKYYFIVFIN